MNIFLHGVYLLANGEKVLIDGEVTVSGHVFFRGTTQAGESLSFDARGNRNAIPPFKQGKDIVDRVLGEDEVSFKIFTPGQLYVTPGGRVWEVVAISRDEKFPIIANELLPDNSFHVNVKRFNWDGQPHDGSASYLWRRT